MDVGALCQALPKRFGGDFYSPILPDRRFEDVVDGIEGMSTPHALTLLNEAVSHLGPEECYLEVGTYRGRSLVGASLGHTHDRFVAIENFREFGFDPDTAHAAVLATLEHWGIRDRVRFLRGEAFRMLPKGVLPAPVGVYFYDGAHSRLAQYLGLAAAEPWLADEAVVIVDDATWPQVAASTQAYIDRHPGYELLYDFRAAHDLDPLWCNGIKMYAWRRPHSWTAPTGLDIAWRRLAHLYGHEPIMNAAWNFLPRHPRLSAALKSIYFHGGATVPERKPEQA